MISVRLKRSCISAIILFSLWIPCRAQQGIQQPLPDSIELGDIKMRDVCILPDPVSQTYYMVGAARRNSVRAYTSIDLANWYVPQNIFAAPDSLWLDIPIFGIWAPELHFYNNKYS